jgi:hypothetical protein
MHVMDNSRNVANHYDYEKSPTSYTQLYVKNGFGPITQIMEYKDQCCLGLFLPELRQHREKLLKENTTSTITCQQRTITNFINLVTSCQNSMKEYISRVSTRTIKERQQDQAIGMCQAYRP